LKFFDEMHLGRQTFVAALLWLSLLPTAAVYSQPNPAMGVNSQSDGIHVYAAPDDSAPSIAVLLVGENTMPVAESQGAGGVKWYLVKTKGGVVGWIKQSDSEQSKKIATFFRSLPREADGVSIDSPKTPPANALSGSIIVPVNLSGRSVIVPVTFNRTLTANLLLDTGASVTMISRRIASSLALYSTRSGLFSGIGGRVVAQIARVDSIKVGDAEVGGMSVSIYDFAASPQIDGLLGMDFLGRFRVSVDSAKQVLVLSPR
jgi:hypothetical protein